jgi:DNA-directed RNA polymerase subunit RPC12/RpoP
MTVALQERSAQRLFETGEERNLDDVVTTAWATLSVRGSARCLVCGATVTRVADEREGRSAADCSGCGSRLE